MVNISDSLAKLVGPLEFVYVCTSEQMPKVLKVGETHRQTPQRRASQFSGVDKRVTWRVLRAFPTPDSKHSEKLVHARLNALDVRHGNYREMFVLEPAELFGIIENCIAHTPTPPPRLVIHTTRVALPLEPGPWELALSLPFRYLDTPNMTIAHAMALAAEGNRPIQKRLLEQGIQLVYPDVEKPHFLIYSTAGTKLAEWLQNLGISWAALNVPEGGLSRKVKCAMHTGR